MNHEEMLFEEFLAARMREKGVTLKRLGELTGISPTHLENLLRGSFEDMPSSPYLHGYIVRVGKTLDFDGEEWWKKIKAGELVRNAGPSDVLPRNRFVKKDLPKTPIAIGAIVLAVLVYVAFEFSRITGKPSLTILNPPATPWTTQSSTITMSGIVKNADALYLSNGNNPSSTEEITFSSDGSWQKIVLLGGGKNDFVVSAKKFLGSETDVTEEIIYEAPAQGKSSSSSSNLSYPTIHPGAGTPATGTFFN